MSGIRVFNGVGEQDDSWIPEVLDVHEALVKAGVESVHVVFPGQRHMVDEDFDETVDSMERGPRTRVVTLRRRH